MSTMLSTRMNFSLKARAGKALENMSLSVSSLCWRLYRLITAKQALPTQLRMPNQTTKTAMKETDEIIRDRKLRFSSVEDMINSLEK